MGGRNVQVPFGPPGLMRRALVRQRGTGEQLVWLAVLAAIPVVVRLLVSPAPHATPFLAFWPSILVAALLLELRYAVAVVLCAGLGSRLLGAGPVLPGAGTEGRLIWTLLALACVTVVLALGQLVRATVRELHALAGQQERFNRELRHRSRSLLAIVQALSAPGPRAENPLDFFRDFALRLDSLAKASDLLRLGAEAEGQLPALIERTVEPFAGDRRIRMVGGNCTIPDESCIPLILAIHELCTNALRHGALSVPGGIVELRWFLGPQGDRLYVLWQEHGGPEVSAPQRQGAGTHLLRTQPGLDAVDLNFDPHGVWCEIMILGARAEPTAETD